MLVDKDVVPKKQLIVGLEIANYARSTISTGIQRVISGFHDDVSMFWEARGISLLPLVCQKPSNYDFRLLLNSSKLGQPFLSKPLCEPGDCDAILLLDIDNGIDFLRLRKLADSGIPVVALIYDILPLLHPDWFIEGGRQAFQLFLQQTLFAASQLITTTKKVRNDILNLDWNIRQEIEVVPLGASFPVQRPRNLPNSQISLLYVSTVEPRKGHDLLLDAFDLLLADGHDVDLTLVGYRGWKIDDTVNRIVEHSEFNGRLKWIQNASDWQVMQLARESNIGVVPSRGEGFGLFVEEALTMGLKVVASAIPEFRERHQPNLTFCELNATALAEGIVSAAAKPWIECVPPRTMKDFSSHLANLVERLAKSSQ